jgi:hypothetical protein
VKVAAKTFLKARDTAKTFVGLHRCKPYIAVKHIALSGLFAIKAIVFSGEATIST